MTNVGVVLMAYGSPADTSDILRYYTDIRRGRPPTDEQLADLTRRYDAIGGLSPLLERTEAQRRAVEAELERLAPEQYTVVLGLKHSAPTIEAAVEAVAGRGVERVVGAVLAPHYSGLSVGQYLSRLEDAAGRYGLGASGIQSWAVEPAFVEFLARELGARLATMPEATRVVFTAHSLPARVIATGDPYPTELRATAQAVTGALDLVEGEQWETAWQSAGRTPEPWMTPDILSVIDRLGADPTVEGVVVCACGFVADHLEVLYDLDVDARRRAESVGLRFDRTRCVNDDPSVMGALAARIAAA
jgi:protoporphyrin/coproporphyrin ferrochelatase